MVILKSKRNQQTQPLKKHRIFSNWDVVTKGWYIFCPSREIKKNEAHSRTIAHQHIAVYRDSSGVIYALDGYCPHMGVDLGIGKVVNGNLRCFFHHWQFNSQGECIHLPAQKEIPQRAKLQAYATEEKYGFIWVYPERTAPFGVAEVPELEGQEVTYLIGEEYKRTCHYHITMINGIDPQHLKTVHNINIDVGLEMKAERPNELEIELAGETPNFNLKEKLARFFLGNQYAYSMKYVDGNIGVLTINKRVKLFNRYAILPTLHMIFAYQPIREEQISVQVVYLTKKRKGLFGFLASRLCIWLTKISFHALQGEDGEVYENIRFNTETLIPMDAPVAKYIQYINKLEPSIWSKSI